MKKVLSILIGVYISFLCNSYFNTGNTTQSEITPPQETTSPSGIVWYDTGSLTVTNPSLAEGNCVDRAVTVLNLLKRRSTLKNVYAAVSLNHVQIAKKVGREYKFLELISHSVFNSEPDFKWGEDLVFYDPDLFLAAANKIKPEMTLSQLKQFASEYKEHQTTDKF